MGTQALLEMVTMTLFNSRFVPPDFRSGEVELRVESGEVCIYASKEGLEKLVELCQVLLNARKEGHIHLQDHNILTEQSVPGVLALFERSGRPIPRPK